MSVVVVWQLCYVSVLGVSTTSEVVEDVRQTILFAGAIVCRRQVVRDRVFRCLGEVK